MGTAPPARWIGTPSLSKPHTLHICQDQRGSLACWLWVVKAGSNMDKEIGEIMIKGLRLDLRARGWGAEITGEGRQRLRGLGER